MSDVSVSSVSHLVVAAMAALTPPLSAQSNIVSGRDMRLVGLHSPTFFGRRGAAHPDGEVGIAYAYYACNPGSVEVPWAGPFNGPQPMRTDHPFWSFLVVREANGRMVQVSGRDTFVKHATSASNSSTFCPGPCTPSSTSRALGVGCGDAYSATTNGNRFWLGPAGEIDPWLGAWDPIGSYFDRGDPAVPFPANTDGVRSLTSGAFADPVKNRVTLREADLLAGGRFVYQMNMLVQGEDADLRGDNVMHREMMPAWNGTTWSFADTGPEVHGTVLDAWTGATVGAVRNGEDDGTFVVAVLVTEPVPGTWHYEYAVYNLDNGRGAASFGVPSCAGITNIGFRDPDDDPLNDWTWTQQGAELLFQAPAGAALQWNQLFNFWFDAPVPPAAGDVTLEQALPGPGALRLGVGLQVPGGLAVAEAVGSGCGAPQPVLSGRGRPVIPDPAFALQFATSPQAALVVAFSSGMGNMPIGAGCTLHLDPLDLNAWGLLIADNAGSAVLSLPIPNDPTLDGVLFYWQAAQVVNGGPVLNQFTLSNGLRFLVGCR